MIIIINGDSTVGTGGTGGTGGDGTPHTEIPASMALTDQYFKYDAASNQLVATREVQTTLDSFYLGEQHKISSGGENMWFTNLSSGIAWSPPWSGVLPQSVITNRGAGGIIEPTVRTYEDMISVVLNGEMSGSGVVPYLGTTTLTSNLSSYAIRFMTEEVIAADDWLTYRMNYDTIDGVQGYEQTFTGTAYAIGDIIELWFTHPVEGGVGTTFVTSLDIAKGNQDAVPNLLNVRESVNAGDHWLEISVRIYTDRKSSYRKSVIHSAAAVGAYTITDNDHGSELHIEDDSAVILPAADLEDNFTMSIINTTDVVRDITFTGATYVGFRDGGNSENISENGSIPVQPNDIIYLTITANGNNKFVNLKSSNPVKLLGSLTDDERLSATSLKDIDLAVTSSSTTTFINEDQDIVLSSDYVVDTTNGALTLPVDRVNGLTSFTVRDANQTFSVANACVVDFGGTQGTATLQTANDSYLFYWDNAQWRFINLINNIGGIV